MKPKALWTTAGIMLGLLGLVAGQYFANQTPVFTLEITSQNLTVKAPAAPTKNLAELKNLTEGQTEQYASASYLKLQPGLWLINLGTDRVFVMSNDFSPEDLDPTLPIDFSSDWTVLEKSSLLPKTWPIPNRGWVVLNTGTLSKRIQALSTEHKKPVVRPANNDTVKLQKEPEGDWQVMLPK